MAHEGCIDAVNAAAEARKKKMSQNESREPVGVMTRSQSCEIVTVGQQRALRQSFGSLQQSQSAEDQVPDIVVGCAHMGAGAGVSG